MNHGVYVSEQATGVSTPVVAASGIPFVVGVSPVQAAESPATVNKPVLCTSWDEAVEKLGYSDDWDKYSLCEFMYSHFKLFACQPVIFVNAMDLSTDKEAVTASDIDVADHKCELPFEAIDDANLIVKAAGGIGTAYVKDTDYSVYYSDTKCIVELLSGTHYSEAELNIAYNKAKPASVVAADIVTSLEAIELCMSSLGVTPDLIVAPGFSKTNTVAAAMAAKCESINGMFHAKAVIDIDSSASGATTYSDVATKKSAAGLINKNEIVCWPMAKVGTLVFHMSTLLAGLMAKVDSDNAGCPYESPSNKGLNCTGLCLEDGTEVTLTIVQANVLNGIGVVTGLNFINGWVAWGNNTACYPSNTDVKDYHIPVARMFAWVNNTLIKTFWSKLDRPMNRRLIDSILDTANIWFNGIVGQGYLLGGRAEMIDSENPLTNLMAGIIKLHVYMTPPSATQEIDFVLEYDASYVTEALS